MATLVYTRYSSTFRRDRLIIGSTLFTAVGVIVLRILLATSLAGSLLLLRGIYVYLEVIAVLATVQFWTLASELLTSRQAKRLFGPVSAMGGLRGILGGAFVSLFAAPLGTANLLFVVIAAQIGCIICVWILGHRNETELQQVPATRSDPAQQQSSLSQGFREIRAMPLLMSMATITVITTMVSNIVDYQFDLTMQANFQGDETTLTAFLGSFYFWAGIVGFIFQMFFSSRLLGHFGLSFGLAILPLSFALGSTMILATGASLWAVTATRASENIFRYNLNDIAFGLLDLHVRSRSKAVITGMLKPVSGGLSGVLFLVVGSLRGISPVPWSILVLLLVAVWLILIRRVRGQYQEALFGSIRRRRFDPATDAIDISDETTIPILLDSLQQADDAQVLQALSLIAEAPDIDWSSALIPLLDHPAIEVRVAALQRLGNPLYEEHADLIRQQIDTSTGEVRAAAITAFCAMRGAEATPELALYLESEVPSVRAATVVGIIRYTGLDGIIQGSLALKEMLDHPDPAMRRAGADVLGRLEVKSLYQPLLTFFKDPDPNVQNQALHAAGKLRHPNLLPGIIACLGAPVTMSAATQALLAYGEESCIALGDALFASDEIVVCRQIPKVLGRIPSSLSARILLQHLDMGDDYARARVYKALVRLQARGVTISADPTQLTARLEEELRLAYATAVSQIDLGHYGGHLLLADALAERQRFAYDIGDCLYILVDGHIKVEVDEVGEINRQGPREVVGEMAIISQKPRSATCTALTDITALRVFHEDFWDLLSEKPALSMGVIRVLSSRLHQRLELLPTFMKTN